MRRRLLEIDPQQLLASREHAKLDGCRERSIAQERRRHAIGGEQSLERVACLVVAQHRQQAGMSAQRCDVARDVGRAAGSLFGSRDLRDRDRCLR